MIFAGYSKEMEDFLSVNPGLARRIPYRYTFHAYTHEQLMQVAHRAAHTSHTHTDKQQQQRNARAASFKQSVDCREYSSTCPSV